MVLSCAVVSLNDAIFKWLTSELAIGQLIFLRALAMLVLVPLIARRDGGLVALRVNDVRGQGLRAGLMVASVFLFANALKLLPLATAIALLFAAPLFAALFATRMLGERIEWRRMVALLLGFVGIWTILRPGGDSSCGLLCCRSARPRAGRCARFLPGV